MALSLRYVGARPYTEFRINGITIGFSRGMVRDDIDSAKAKTMLLAQASREQRLRLNGHLPTDVIENNSKVSDLKEKVQALNQKLFSLI